MEEVSWREKESWKRNHGRGIMEKESWKRHHPPWILYTGPSDAACACEEQEEAAMEELEMVLDEIVEDTDLDAEEVEELERDK